MLKLFLYYLTVVVLHRVLGSPGWLSIHDPPALTSWMLGLQVCTAMPGSLTMSLIHACVFNRVAHSTCALSHLF